MKKFIINESLCEIKHLIWSIILILPFTLIGYISNKSFFMLLYVVLFASMVFFTISFLWKIISKERTIIEITKNNIMITQSNRFSQYFEENIVEKYPLENIKIKFKGLPFLEYISIGDIHSTRLERCSLSTSNYNELINILKQQSNNYELEDGYEKKDFLVLASLLFLFVLIIKFFY